jgi:hypothetical protein
MAIVTGPLYVGSIAFEAVSAETVRLKGVPAETVPGGWAITTRWLARATVGDTTLTGVVVTVVVPPTPPVTFRV